MSRGKDCATTEGLARDGFVAKSHRLGGKAEEDFVHANDSAGANRVNLLGR
jgi:hypothetical protein